MFGNRRRKRQEALIERWWEQIEILEERIKREKIIDSESKGLNILRGRQLALMNCIEELEDII